jgi:hypothetical protein
MMGAKTSSFLPQKNAFFPSHEIAFSDRSRSSNQALIFLVAVQSVITKDYKGKVRQKKIRPFLKSTIKKPKFTENGEKNDFSTRTDTAINLLFARTR